MCLLLLLLRNTFFKNKFGARVSPKKQKNIVGPGFDCIKI
jgi:hypothetical protein